MADVRRCPQCGTELPAEVLEGICPKCLLKLALEGQQGPQGGPQSGETTTPEPRFAPPEPQELANHFPQLEVLGLVGSGGMGVVYKARQRELDRLVAVKILPPEVGQDPAFAERFAREARALAKLNHPNIVAVHDFGQTDGLYYFVMEFVDGVNLRQMIQAGELKPQEALAIVPQICDALQYAHDEGIVHRDIKPENVLLDTKGRVKIADFGLAKLLGRSPTDFTLTGTQQVMGTPHYMAPEQMEKPLEVDHRADIYSLGVVFYEMLTGELPLGRFAPPSRKVHVDVRLDHVVLRALEKEPERRYQHVSEVKTDVEALSSGPCPADGQAPDTSADISLRNLRRQVAWISAGIGMLAAAIGWFAASPDISSILGWGFILFALIFNVIVAWCLRGTNPGPYLRYLAFFTIGTLLIALAMPFGLKPEPTLSWLYQWTGATPGRHDVVVVQNVFGIAVLAFLAYAVWFLSWLFGKWRRFAAQHRKGQDH